MAINLHKIQQNKKMEIQLVESNSKCSDEFEEFDLSVTRFEKSRLNTLGFNGSLSYSMTHLPSQNKIVSRNWDDFGKEFEDPEKVNRKLRDRKDKNTDQMLLKGQLLEIDDSNFELSKYKNYLEDERTEKDTPQKKAYEPRHHTASSIKSFRIKRKCNALKSKQNENLKRVCNTQRDLIQIPTGMKIFDWDALQKFEKSNQPIHTKINSFFTNKPKTTKNKQELQIKQSDQIKASIVTRPKSTKRPNIKQRTNTLTGVEIQKKRLSRNDIRLKFTNQIEQRILKENYLSNF